MRFRDDFSAGNGEAMADFVRGGEIAWRPRTISHHQPFGLERWEAAGQPMPLRQGLLEMRRAFAEVLQAAFKLHLLDETGEGWARAQLRFEVTGRFQDRQLGTDAGCGNNRLEVSADGVSVRTVVCASARPGPAAQINIGSGNNQRMEAGAPAAERLRAWVSDSCNGIAAVEVTFTVTRGSGRVNGAASVTVPTGPTGHAAVDFVLGPEAGNQTVEAQFDGNLRRRFDRPTGADARISEYFDPFGERERPPVVQRVAPEAVGRRVAVNQIGRDGVGDRELGRELILFRLDVQAR